MQMKKFIFFAIIAGLLLFSARLAIAEKNIGQTVQITTHFSSFVGKPSWLIIIRDETTGQVLPYVFDVRNNDNFWIAFSNSHDYKLTVSKLTFGPHADISNFCHLENGLISGKSFFITVTGDLTPIRNNAKCQVMQYKDVLPFTVVNH